MRKYTSEAEVIKAVTKAGYTDIYKTTLLGVGLAAAGGRRGDGVLQEMRRTRSKRARQS